MQAYRIKLTIDQDGKLALNNLPFQQGDAVEVIILSEEPKQDGSNRYPLRGTSIIYKDPTEPVAHDQWEALE
jgi:hypothetical protein